jgi:hypothetical protein
VRSQHVKFKKEAAKMKLFEKYLLGRMFWVAALLLIIGLPRESVYITEPVVCVKGVPKPLLNMAGTRTLVDPLWPNGRPSVCENFRFMQHQLLPNLQNVFAGDFLHNLLEKLLDWAIDCSTVLKLFCVWSLMTTSINVYFIEVVHYYHRLLRFGGDGITIMGNDPDPQHSDFADHHRKNFMQNQIDLLFEGVDTNKDDLVSKEEFLEWIEKEY